MISRNAVAWFILTLSVSISCLLKGAEPAAKPVFLYGSRAGQPTFDMDAQGGNPFATALVQLLSRKAISFTAFETALIALTRQASHGVQEAEIVGGDHLSEWQFLPQPQGQKWVALVVVFSAYDTGVGPSLPGAKRDLRRIAEALFRAGFVVREFADPDRETLARGIKDFERSTVRADVAVIYTTGHGIEADGIARVLLPYARAAGSDALTVSELARSARAKRANLIFYAACRNKPR